jgi:hypothetical protein
MRSCSGGGQGTVARSRSRATSARPLSRYQTAWRIACLSFAISGGVGIGLPFVMFGTGLWPAFLKVRHAWRPQSAIGFACPIWCKMRHSGASRCQCRADQSDARDACDAFSYRVLETFLPPRIESASRASLRHCVTASRSRRPYLASIGPPRTLPVQPFKRGGNAPLVACRQAGRGDFQGATGDVQN